MIFSEGIKSPLPPGEGQGEGVAMISTVAAPWHPPHPPSGHPLPEGEGLLKIDASSGNIMISVAAVRAVRIGKGANYRRLSAIFPEGIL